MKSPILKLLSVLFFLFAVIFVQAQNKNLKADARLYDVKSAAKIQDLEDAGSFKLAAFNYYLDNMYFITDSEPQDADYQGDITTLQTINEDGYFAEDVAVFAQKSFNPFKYFFPIPYDKAIYYSFSDGGQTRYFVTYSRSEYEQRLENYLKANNIIKQ